MRRPASILFVAVIGIALLAVPGASAQSERDPSWVAEVVLDCSDNDLALRTVTEFRVTIDPGQSARLYLATPSGGGFGAQPLEVGASVPASVLMVGGSEHLSWQIVDVLLGPWPVDSVIDVCSTRATLPATGSGMATSATVTGLALGAVGIVLVLLDARRSRRCRVLE